MTSEKPANIADGRRKRYEEMAIAAAQASALLQRDAQEDTEGLYNGLALRLEEISRHMMDQSRGVS